MHHKRLPGSELKIHLLKHAAQAELSAKRVAAVGKVHLADLVGIGLHQHRHVHVAQRGLDAVFVAKVGKRDDHAVILAVMLVQEAVILHALLRGLHRAEAGEGFVHHKQADVLLCGRLRHFPARVAEKLAGEKSPVRYQKRHLHLGVPPFVQNS